MKSSRLRVLLLTQRLALACLLVAAMAALVLSAADQPARHGTVQRIKVHWKSLEGNLEKNVMPFFSHNLSFGMAHH